MNNQVENDGASPDEGGNPKAEVGGIYGDAVPETLDAAFAALGVDRSGISALRKLNRKVIGAYVEAGGDDPSGLEDHIGKLARDRGVTDATLVDTDPGREAIVDPIATADTVADEAAPLLEDEDDLLGLS